MSATKVRPPILDDVDDRQARQVRTAIQQLTKANPKSVIVPNITLTTSTAMVPHQLGVQPSGWIVVDKTAQADVWRDTSAAATSDLFPLKASATVTVSIQFFANQ
jgi:hypothetical protein